MTTSWIKISIQNLTSALQFDILEQFEALLSTLESSGALCYSESKRSYRNETEKKLNLLELVNCISTLYRLHVDA